MAKKKLYDENGNEVTGVKEKKPFYKKWWFWLIVGIVLIALNPTGDAEESTDTTTDATTETSTSEIVEESSSTETVDGAASEEKTISGTESSEPDVPREYANALKSAQNYIDIMDFSEAGLYQQLTSEYGEQYPEEAAQYAIENVKADYNEEALQSAQSYQEIMPMSDGGLYDQLTSEYGEQFTAEQAQYAIDNLE